LISAGISWVITERRPPAPERRFSVHPRISFPHALFQRILPYYNRFMRSARPVFAIILAAVAAATAKANRLARRNAKLTIGAAAAAAVIVAVVAAGVSGGSAPAPAERVAAASQHVAAKDAAADHAAKQAPSKRAPSKQDSANSPAAKSPAKTNSGNSSADKHKSSSQHGASQHSASKHGAPQHSASKHGAAPAHHKAPARKPYLIYDSVTPSAIPAHRAAAIYATGNYAASPSDTAGHSKVMWIDVTGYDHAASVLDVEPGDATPPMAASWAWHRLHNNPKALARIYTMRSQWPAVKAAIGHLPANMRSHVRYWIADPTGSPHVVPGSDATQWYWGKSYDISTATPRF
jgi:hypothetical protein